MNLQVYIDKLIKEICPIHGVSFGYNHIIYNEENNTMSIDESLSKPIEDKSTWQISFKDEATEEQKQAALAFIESFVWDPINDAQYRAYKKEMRDNEKLEDLTLIALYDSEKKSRPDIAFSDYLDELEVKQKAEKNKRA